MYINAMYLNKKNTQNNQSLKCRIITNNNGIQGVVKEQKEWFWRRRGKHTYTNKMIGINDILPISLKQKHFTKRVKIT